MSYRLKRKRFKCGQCNSTYFALAQEEEIHKQCENCGKVGYEETKEEEDLMPERKRKQLIDGAYRIVFNNDNQNQYHNKTNIRDRSIDNVHGDSYTTGQGYDRQRINSDFSGQAPGQNVHRTPNPQPTTKLNGVNASGRPPTGMRRQQQSSTTLPNIDSRASQRPRNQNQQQNTSGQPRVNMTRQEPGPSRQQQQRPNQGTQNNQNNRTSNQQPQPAFANMRNASEIRMNQQAPPPSNQNQNYHSQNNNGPRRFQGQQNENPFRARSTTIRTGDGRLIQVVQFGIPNPRSSNNQPSGDQNIPHDLPDLEQNPFMGPGAHPVFFFRRNGGGSQMPGGMSGAGPDGQLPGMEGLSQMLNTMLRDFQNMFTGHEFLRMNTIFQGFSPDQFMTNFNSNFFSDEAFMEMAQRMSAQEAAQAKQKKAAESSVSKLPIVKIENKHCKKNQSGTLEAPTCTVCCENIGVGSKGMFMPCGHIYHPDCLKPWLEQNNTCPVCRYELPTQQE